MAKEKTIGELINDYESSNGYNIFDFLLKTKCMCYILDNNFKELLNHINRYEKETLSKGKKFKEKKLTKIKSRNYLKKFIKYFHNYAAAVYSMECHYNEFLASSGSARQEFKGIKQDPLRLLIFALRNNITHHTTPPISISISHKKRIMGQGETLFLTSGHFKVSISAILSDHRHAIPGSGGKSDSKFLKYDSERNALCAYISTKYKGSSSIDLKNIIKGHHKTFLEYIDKIDNELIGTNETEYNKTKKLYKEIIKRQSKL